MTKSKPRGKLRYLPSLVALSIVVVFYFLSQPPTLNDQQAKRLADEFTFVSHKLPVLANGEGAKIRQVHPSLQHFAAWISFVGAAVSMGDLDGDGLPNDIAYVDTRFDQITVCPAPVGESRYEPFVLKQAELPFQESSTAPMGTLFGDFNEDGWQDVLAFFWGRSPIIYLRGEHIVESASPRPAALVLDDFTPVELVNPPEVWHTSNITQADADGDGHLDLIVGNYNPDGAATLDANATGSETMMGSWGRAANGGRNRLLLWSGTTSSGPHFKEAKEVFPNHIVRGWTLATGAADLDGDLLPEIYFIQDFGPDHLLHNRTEQKGEPQFALLKGQRDFLVPRSKILGMDTFNGMGVDFGDLNGDGMLDMMVSNITSDYGLHQSNFAFIHSGEGELMKAGVAPFRDESEKLGLSRSGWGWECKLGDFNNDGVPEVLQATGFLRGEADRWPNMHELGLANEELAKWPIVYPRLGLGDELSGHERNPFFVRCPDRNCYFDMSAHLSGLDDDKLGRGIATADVDGDGNLDFCRANQWDESFFYHNQPRAGAGNFLGLHLRLALEPTDGDEVAVFPHPQSTGEPPSLPAIGATVSLDIPGRKLIGQVDGGNGHSGRRSPDLHFGLGDHEDAVTVNIRWRGRDGTPRSGSRELKPGWHTILLGKPGADS